MPPLTRGCYDGDDSTRLIFTLIMTVIIDPLVASSYVLKNERTTEAFSINLNEVVPHHPFRSLSNLRASFD